MIAAMQPLSEPTLTRPWHWGLAILGDPTAEVPTDLTGRRVSIAERSSN